MCPLKLILLCFVLLPMLTHGVIEVLKHNIRFLKKEIVLTDEDPPVICFLAYFGIYFAVCLCAAFKSFNIPIPYRIFVIFTGSIFGMFLIMKDHAKTYEIITNIPLQYALISCMPILLFSQALCIDTHVFMRSWGQILLLAGPGKFVTSAFIGLVMMMLMHKDWSIPMALLFGAICSTIYPMEAVKLLMQSGQAKYLSVLLQGEGMLGDASVIIMYKIYMGFIKHYIIYWYQVLIVIARYALGGAVCGWITGELSRCIMPAMYNDPITLVVFTVAASYVTYYSCSQLLITSGEIAVIVLGIYVAMERTSLPVNDERLLLYSWDTLARIIITIIYLFAGVIITEGLYAVQTPIAYTAVVITCIIATVGRFLTYLALAPLLTRIGYGLTVKGLAVAVWAAVRGPVAFCLTLHTCEDGKSYNYCTMLKAHAAGLVILTMLINGTTMPLVLKVLGITELSVARKINMNICMRYVKNRRDRTIAMLRMNRFLADVNWPLVHSQTLLKHPYMINYEDVDEEEYFSIRSAVCPDCLKEVPNEPTQREVLEMTREAHMRVLKAKKVSYSRQYENGMLSKDAIRVLTQAVEVAMDTPDALIEIDGLHRYFRREGFVYKARRHLLARFFQTRESNIKPPRKHWRKVCYNIVFNPMFEVVMYGIIIINVIPIILQLNLMFRVDRELSITLKLINTFFFMIYLTEFLLKLFAYSYVFIYKHGFKTYFRNHCNIFDFCILCIHAVDVGLDYYEFFSKNYIKELSHVSQAITIGKLFRILRFLRLCRLCRAWYPKIITYYDSKIDKHLAFAYDVGKGFAAGEEEVSNILVRMIDNSLIREECRMRMQTDRLAVTKQLGMVQKDRPWIAITVKTKQAITATLNSIADAIWELKVSGWVDESEYLRLLDSLEESRKNEKRKVKSVQPSSPIVIFNNVPWMTDEKIIRKFLYENVEMRIFDNGEVVCAAHEMPYGIYIIITGMFRVSYIPKKEVLYSLAEYGRLPIIDYMSSIRFEERRDDYVVSGNCIGELSVLTGRPNACTITAESSSQAYVLTHEVVKQAFEKSPDPVHGLESRMWKYISVRLATSILMDIPIYQSSSLDKIRTHLERAFVPDLSNYKSFGVNDLIEDIILIEGVVFDFNTRDCYTAPCYIPRTVQKIVLPKSSQMNIDVKIESKLLIVPGVDADEFEIMEKEMEISEMVSSISVKCLQHTIQKRKTKWRKRKKKRQTTFLVGKGRAMCDSSKSSGSETTEVSTVERELRNTSMDDGVKATSDVSLHEKKVFPAYMIGTPGALQPPRFINRIGPLPAASKEQQEKTEYLKPTIANLENINNEGEIKMEEQKPEVEGQTEVSKETRKKRLTIEEPGRVEIVSQTQPVRKSKDSDRTKEVTGIIKSGLMSVPSSSSSRKQSNHEHNIIVISKQKYNKDEQRFKRNIKRKGAQVNKSGIEEEEVLQNVVDNDASIVDLIQARKKETLLGKAIPHILLENQESNGRNDEEDDDDRNDHVSLSARASYITYKKRK